VPRGLDSLGGAGGSDGGGSSSLGGLDVWTAWRAVEEVQRGATRAGSDSRPKISAGRAGQYILPTELPPLPRSPELLLGQTAAAAAAAAAAAEQAQQREQAVLWLLKSAAEFCKCDRTVHLAVAILDQVQRLEPPPTSAAAQLDGTADAGSPTKLLGIAALLLACKFQEVEIHQVEEFVYYASISNESPTHEPPYLPPLDSTEVLEAEVRICAALRVDDL
jgi:hypothetical protein